MNTLSPKAQAIFETADLFGEGGKSFNAEFAAIILRSVVENCSGADYDGGKRVATILCADVISIANELEQLSGAPVPTFDIQQGGQK